MKNVNPTTYVSPKLEIVVLESDDIMSTSGAISPGTKPDNGYVGDDNVLENW